MKSDKPTIAEVARLARVSKTTVSRYLNGRFEFMSIETKQRIEAVIEELGYRPNNLARGLKSNRSGLIGVLVADISSPFSSILVKGVGDFCKGHGFQTIISNTDNEAVKEREYIEAMIDNRVEGLIINTTGKNASYLHEIYEQGIPVVLADRPMEALEFDTVTTNNYQMTYETIKYLYGQGFQKVAFFTQCVSGIRTRFTRRQAFLQACEDLYGGSGEKWIAEVNVDDGSAVTQQVLQFVRDATGPVAAFAVNGVTLLSLVQAVSQTKLRVPWDIGLCGYDDWGWAAIIPPGITVISQPSYKVGREAARRLILQIQSGQVKKPTLVEFPSELILRGSTALKS